MDRIDLAQIVSPPFAEPVEIFAFFAFKEPLSLQIIEGFVETGDDELLKAPDLLSSTVRSSPAHGYTSWKIWR
jgi:hypothetical protein